MSHDKPSLKDTVLTPKTEFDMRASLTTREPETLKRWYAPQPDGSANLYEAIRKHRSGAPLFVLHDGPPYANGDAHTGTGMNKILKDTVVKYKTLQGFDCPYIPGWDCHGLPIEHKVLEKLGGKKPEDMTALEVREQCLEFARSFIDRQRGQFQRTLTLGRWEEPYLTINPVYEGAVLDCFADLMRHGYIARHKKPVHWSWAARSALAEAELEYEDRKDPSIFVKFAMRTNWDGEADDTWRFGDLPDSFFEHFLPAGETKATGSEAEEVACRKRGAENRLKVLADKCAGKPIHFVIWTTTPWTLPANIAIALSAQAEYGFYAVGEEVWVIASDLAAEVLEKAGVSGESLFVMRGGDLLGLTYEQPLWKTPCMLFPADYVTLDDGTGLVHTAPGHGAEDFTLGQTYGLPTICPVDERGCYYAGDRLREELQLKTDWQDDDGWFAAIEGQHFLKANKLIVEKLVGSGQMVYWFEFNHSYPHCWRTHQPVIFRATEQWFVKVDHVSEGKDRSLRQLILDEIAKTRWFPSWGEKRIGAMVGGRPDWCISRQRYWGIPIPAFLDAESGQVCATAEVAQHIADLVRSEGSNVWFDDANWPTDKLLPDAVRPDAFKGKQLTKLNDIFDVWFESGASHRGVVLAEKELQGDATSYRPADLYLEGDDQHRGWFQVSLILAVATQGIAPFKDCLTSAFVVDEKGQKGSKSKGNIFAIDWGCEQIGADLLRLYFASVDTSSPIPVTLDLVKDKTSGTYRTLRNTIRVLLGNLSDFDPAKHALANANLLEIDRWMLSRLSACVADVTKSMESYEFHVATRRLVDFLNIEVSAFYVDVTKDRLYCDRADGHARRSGQTAMYQLVKAVMAMLAPICPHTADEAWAFLPGKGDDEFSVLMTNYPKAADFPRDTKLEVAFEQLLEIKVDVDRVLDRLRKDKTLKNSTTAKVTLGLTAALANTLAARVREGGLSELGANDLTPLHGLLSVSEVSIQESADLGEAGQEVEGLRIAVEVSSHTRCDRCWNHFPSVTAQGEHHICGRCTAAIA